MTHTRNLVAFWLSFCVSAALAQDRAVTLSPADVALTLVSIVPLPDGGCRATAHGTLSPPGEDDTLVRFSAPFEPGAPCANVINGSRRQLLRAFSFDAGP